MSAARRIERHACFERNQVIINLGSVDILHGHDLVDMRHDFEELLRVCEARGLQPIITTLAPLANGNHSPDARDKLIAFNRYLIDRFSQLYQVIDVYPRFVNQRGQTLYDCYQP